ncbi:MAG: CvpA family protein [Candidatus Aminicenantes bacterium]|jgi:membrane protein required for colicin V production|nr:CvpA family protein [Candidatus Aminicenantes bacterium]
MILNWLDIVLFIIIVGSLVLGIIKGLMRQVIGLAAVLLGLVLALVYYPYVSQLYLQWIESQVLSHFLGFITIFIAVLCLGWLISWLISKIIKGPIKFINHVLGGGLGLLKGVLICGILVFALLVFPVSVQALRNSFLAPYCLGMTKLVAKVIPQELKDTFKETYEVIMGGRPKNAKRV